MVGDSAEAMDSAGLTDMVGATAMAGTLAATVIALGTPVESSSSEVGDIPIPGATPITTDILLITTLGIPIIRRPITAPGLTLAIRAPAFTEAIISVGGRIERRRVATQIQKKDSWIGEISLRSAPRAHRISGAPFQPMLQRPSSPKYRPEATGHVSLQVGPILEAYDTFGKAAKTKALKIIIET